MKKATGHYVHSQWQSQNKKLCLKYLTDAAGIRNINKREVDTETDKENPEYISICFRSLLRNNAKVITPIKNAVLFSFQSIVLLCSFSATGDIWLAQ